MTLSEIRKSDLPEADKKMLFYDRMLTLMWMKRHYIDSYFVIYRRYLYWKLKATGQGDAFCESDDIERNRIVEDFSTWIRHSDS